MNNNEQIKLIDGTFSPEGAAEVLFAVLDDKIRFHNIRILSIQERFGGDTSQSENRIKELKAAKAKVKEVLDEAKRTGAEVELFSMVDIKVKPGTGSEKVSVSAVHDN